MKKKTGLGRKVMTLDTGPASLPAFLGTPQEGLDVPSHPGQRL